MEISKSISIRDLYECVGKWNHEGKSFIVDSDNCRNLSLGGVCFKLFFTEMSVSLHPENVILSNPNGDLIMFKDIHSIRVISDPALSWSICEITHPSELEGNCKRIITKILID